MTQHTPGPWHKASWVDGHDICITAANDDWIADVCSGDVSEEQQCANARLIAAAPELLTLVQKIKDRLGFAEWADPTDAEDILNDIINDFYCEAERLTVKVETGFDAKAEGSAAR